VRLGVEFNTHATAAWIALDRKLFSKYGVDVVKVVKYRSGVELAAAFAKGDVDAAWACLAPIVKMIDQGAKLYIIAAAHYYGYGCVGRPGIDSLVGLKRLGRVKVAVTGNGAAVHILALMVMEKYHINGSIVFIKPPAILSAVLSGAVDVACLPEHYLSIAEYRGLKVLVTAQDLWRGMPGSYLVVTERLVRENPRLVCALAKINMEATEYAIAHPAEAAKINAKKLGVPVEVAARSLSRLKLTWKLNPVEMQKLVDYMYAHHMIRRDFNITRFILDVNKLCKSGEGD
jgi:ABC-type nitrate/sulfonate/bicarbonate transport system substrate-binding protein